ncbi:MAG: hypothetical protein ACJ786_13025 [Catenulispora sp.]
MVAAFTALAPFAPLTPATALVVPTLPGLLRPASELLLDPVSQLPLPRCRFLAETPGLLVQHPELLSQLRLVGPIWGLPLVWFVHFV